MLTRGGKNLAAASRNDSANTAPSPYRAASSPPAMGPTVNERPRVASANPYAGARSAGGTRSAMYANVSVNVAVSAP